PRSHHTASTLTLSRTQPHTTSTPPLPSFFFFFFNDTPPTEISTLSLHDALPIWKSAGRRMGSRGQAALGPQQLSHAARRLPDDRQSLPADVCDPLQLADCRNRARDRSGHPALLQFPARG